MKKYISLCYTFVINILSFLFLFLFLFVCLCLSPRVAGRVEVNKMSVMNLATVFGPSLLRPPVARVDISEEVVVQVSHMSALQVFLLAIFFFLNLVWMARKLCFEG